MIYLLPVWSSLTFQWFQLFLCILVLVAFINEVDDYLRIGETKRGVRKLIHRGYVYNRKRFSGMKEFWRCERHNGGCYAEITLVGTQILKARPHSHGPDWNECWCLEMEFDQNMKKISRLYNWTRNISLMKLIFFTGKHTRSVTTICILILLKVTYY